MTPRPEWTGLAGRALTAALAHDWTRASAAVTAIATRFGDQVIPRVLLAWIDTVIIRCGIVHTPGQVVGIAWQREGGPITEADDTPPGVRWAGRVVAARLADDEPQFRALVNSCADEEEWRQGVSGVLDVCAAMLRRHGDLVVSSEDGGT